MHCVSRSPVPAALSPWVGLLDVELSRLTGLPSNSCGLGTFRLSLSEPPFRAYERSFNDLQRVGASARSAHFVRSTPLITNHNASDDSATKGGSMMTRNSLEASVGYRISAKLFVK